jgi:hypothetical protein
MNSTYTDTYETSVSVELEDPLNPKPEELTEAAEKGSRCDTKDLYRLARVDDPRKFYWADDKPANFGNDHKGGRKRLVRLLL